MSAAVELKHIKMNYQEESGETAAIHDVSFSVEPGEFVSIVGPSGCGKSTLLSIICGLIKPSSGSVWVQGECVDKPNPALGYMLQRDQLLEWRNILNNALLGLEIQKRMTPENIDYVDMLLDKYGLGDFKYKRPSALSGGMRQRAALIRVLALKPDLLLLDEPFSALDYQTRLYVADEIGSIIRQENKTAILVTHDISEAVSLSDRVIVLSRRPSVVKFETPISFDSEHRSAMKTRDTKEFKDYFNAIWKQLDIMGNI